MNKKFYSVPSLSVVELQDSDVICSSTTEVSGFSGGTVNYGGPGVGAARSNDRGGIWDEE